MFAASKTDSVSSETPDPQFNYVSMLLHGDGTNGAQNNTFLDSSASPLTLTRNGNTTQGSFSPYGSNWSNYFGGVSRIYTPHNSTFEFGTGDFTMECWINMAAGTPLLSYWASFLSVGADGTSDGNGVSLYVTDGASGSSVAGEVAVNIGAATRIYSGQDIRGLGWVHVAVTRQGSTNRLFLNGVLKSTITNSLNINATNYGASIALSSASQNNYFVGYVSNARVVKGTAVYTSNFTPSTTPLTVISGTSLLTCADNRFIDEANNIVITTVGTPSVQRFNPFGASAAYSTSVIGGSGYFDGTGDYLSTPNVAALQPGTSTNPFCVECWIYPRATPVADTAILGNLTVLSYPTNCNGFDLLHISTNEVAFRWGRPNYNDSGVSSVMALNTWNHIAVCRNSSGSLSCYLNGTRWYNSSVNTSITNATASSFWVGWAGSLSGSTINPFNGYISNARLVNGSSVYDPTSSTLTVPTAPLTAVTNTSLLTNFTNGAIFDNAMINNLETVGNAQISTSVVKYGTGSMAFDGTGDYLIGQVSPNLSFGASNFTIEGWGYVTTTSTTFQCMLSIGAPVQIYARSGTIKIYFNDTDDTNTYIVNGAEGPAGSISANTWFHFAVVRNGTTISAYVNGVAGTPTTGITQQVALSANPISLGIYGATSTLPFTGYMDDIRITNGYARYTANFTPPIVAFSNIGPY